MARRELRRSRRCWPPVEKGVVLHIVSIGHKAAIMPHLNAVIMRFFDEARVGVDCRPPRDLGFVKGALIAELIMQPNAGGQRTSSCG